MKDLCLLLLERPALQSATLLQAMLGDSVSSLEIFKSLTASLHIDETCTSRPLGVTYSFHSKCFTQHDVPSTLDMILKSHRWCSIYRDEHDWRHSLLMDIWSVLRALPCSSPEFIEKTLRIFRCEEINFILDKSSEMNLLVTFLCPQLGENIHLMTSQLSSEENQLLSEYFSQLKPESSTGEFSLESWLNHILYTIAIISYLSYLVRHK